MPCFFAAPVAETIFESTSTDRSDDAVRLSQSTKNARIERFEVNELGDR